MADDAYVQGVADARARPETADEKVAMLAEKSRSMPSRTALPPRNTTITSIRLSTPRSTTVEDELVLTSAAIRARMTYNN
jgi:hypothetical protein